MNADTEVTLAQVHDGIVEAVRAQFTDLVTVEFYLMDRTKLPTPACLLELTEMEAAPDVDPGTGQLAVMASFSAQLVIGFRQPGLNAKLEIRKLAAAFGAFVRTKRWGRPIGPAEVVGIYPDDFDPELDQYECWRVDWQQVLHLGESVWNDPGGQPSQVFISQVPLIGDPYQDEYSQVNA